MHSEYTPHAIVAGFASASILVLSSLIGINLLLGIFCSIPLLYIGIHKSLHAAAISILIASFILLGFSAHLLMVYLIIVAVPCLLLLACILARRPIIDALSEITLYVVVLCSLVQIRLADSGGIQAAMAGILDDKELQNIDPAIVEQLNWMMHEASFIFIALAVYSILLIFYISSWITHGLLQKKQVNIAPYLMFDQTYPPIWLLVLLIISALLSMLGGEGLAYISKLNFMIILLPYVFSGAMYTPLRKWRGMESGWSVVVYVIAFMLTWPAVIFAALGVIKHTEAVVKK